MFLLEGVVCPKLAAFKGKLKCTPPSLVKSWSNLNECFKKALIAKEVNSLQKLHKEWETNENYLLQEYQRFAAQRPLERLDRVVASFGGVN